MWRALDPKATRTNIVLYLSEACALIDSKSQHWQQGLNGSVGWWSEPLTKSNMLPHEHLRLHLVCAVKVLPELNLEKVGCEEHGKWWMVQTSQKVGSAMTHTPWYLTRWNHHTHRSLSSIRSSPWEDPAQALRSTCMGSQSAAVPSQSTAASCSRSHR